MQKRKNVANTDLEKASDSSPLQYRVIFRALALFHHVLVTVTVYKTVLVDTEIPELITMKTYMTRYMTGWNFAIQTYYLLLALLCDLQEGMGRNNGALARKIARFREFVFTSLICPSAMLVTSLFWFLFQWDRELVLPKATEVVITPSINHSIHTVVLVVALLDLLLQPVRKPHNDSHNKMTLYSFCILYQLVSFCTYLEAGHWIYPFMNRLNTPQLVILHVFFSFFYVMLYKLQWSLIAWSRKLRSTRKQYVIENKEF